MTFCLPRIMPFFIFMVFIALEETARFMLSKGFFSFSPSLLGYLYPWKAFTAGALVLLFWNRYSEMEPLDKVRPSTAVMTILTGIVVFVLWIHMDWGIADKSQVFPGNFPNALTKTVMITIRLFGAVVVVPIIEELFWRSFLIRYLINKDFSTVPIGTFTWPSFLAASLLFGLEHNLIMAGIMAGACYNILLYYSKSIVHCILAHAITNLLLGIYVITTGRWYFW